MIDLAQNCQFYHWMNFINILLFCFLTFLIGCSVGRKLDPNAVSSLRKGMTISQVEQLIGPPVYISTAEGGKTYYNYHYGTGTNIMGYGKAKSQTLNLTFTNSRLTHIDKTLTHSSGFFGMKTDKVESGKYSDSDSVQRKPAASLPTRVNSSPSGSYEGKKKQLLDMYLQKEITKEEYFELRRELDKTK